MANASKLIILLIVALNDIEARRSLSRKNNTNVSPSRTISALTHRMLRRYDKTIPPFEENFNAINVSLSVYVQGVRPRPVEGQMGISLIVTQEWKDSRLRYDGLTKEPASIRADLFDQLWMPDIMFPELLDGKIVTEPVPNKMLRIYRNGNIYYSYRFVGNFRCPNLDIMHHKGKRGKPVNCTLQIASYGYPLTDLKMKWKSQHTNYNTNAGGYDWSISKVENAQKIETFSTGQYETLMLKMKLQRL